MALEVVPESISTEPKAYDEAEGKKLSAWVFDLVESDANARKANTREEFWEKDWKFIRGRQWDGNMPSYRRPIKMNAWRRAVHAVEAVLLGGRPTLKLIPQGFIANETLKPWQDALWANLRREQVFETKVPDALGWGLVGDGGVLKIGYGTWAPGSGEEPDVLVSAPHPGQIYPDGDCTDLTFVHCHHITFRDRLDLATITARYPETGKLVSPDEKVSIKWDGMQPTWAKDAVSTIGPAGGWSANNSFRRGMADVAECWIDDPATEVYVEQEITNLAAVTKGWLAKMNGTPFEDKAKLLGMGERGVSARDLMPRLTAQFGAPDVTPEYADVEKVRWRYPKGRVITCTREVVLRDIPNPYAKAFSWAQRWPFVFVPGAVDPHTVWRPGLLADQSDIQWGINKALSLLLENSIKVTNAMVIADEGAIDEDEWANLSLFPGVKILKERGTDVSVVFPQALPPQAFQLADYLIRKLEESVGLQDPQIPPGQVVAAKTMAMMTQKGSFLLGIMAKGLDESLERLGQRMMGLMRDRYLPNRMIPYFEGEVIGNAAAGLGQPLPSLPEGLKLRVEATSAYLEAQQTAAVMAQAAETARAQRRR